ncbi:cytosolic sulfotransferase 15-like [Punica granatum]|uniref:Sulfotransferase n=2 Tax=Punica granatum TaxID=22663 RepID=A0A6P8BMU5_PUNGR|nr:cytosolic sulfotransferase 15-like [Punica granatum]
MHILSLPHPKLTPIHTTPPPLYHLLVPSMAENSKPSYDDQQEIEELISSLPKGKGWHSSGLTLYQNFWCHSKFLPGVISFQRHFLARDSDVLIASKPKSGTTWLKSLAFSVLYRAQFNPTEANANHPLLSSNPHALVRTLELGQSAGHAPDLSGFADPRLFGTHVPYDSLPYSIRRSRCKVIYICRNPLDVVVSLWHFVAQVDAGDRAGGWSGMEEYFDNFCKGMDGYGPFWDHLLGYWKASQERPKKVLFLKYEDLKEDTAGNLKRIAEFMGVPFSDEEERNGVVEEIVKMCSLGSLKELEVNKTGRSIAGFENNSYFRKGEVGDWVNYFSLSMAERLKNIMEEKLSHFGLTFRVN